MLELRVMGLRAPPTVDGFGVEDPICLLEVEIIAGVVLRVEDTGGLSKAPSLLLAGPLKEVVILPGTTVEFPTLILVPPLIPIKVTFSTGLFFSFSSTSKSGQKSSSSSSSLSESSTTSSLFETLKDWN